MSGHTFRDHASFTETMNVPEGTTTVTGISYHYIVGGMGQVYAEIGHKISVTETGEVIFQGGQDDLASDPDLLSLCDSTDANGSETTSRRAGPRPALRSFDGRGPDATRCVVPTRGTDQVTHDIDRTRLRRPHAARARPLRAGPPALA